LNQDFQTQQICEYMIYFWEIVF